MPDKKAERPEGQMRRRPMRRINSNTFVNKYFAFY